MVKLKVQHSFPAYDAFRDTVHEALATPDGSPVRTELLDASSAYEAIRAAIAVNATKHQSLVTKDVSSDLFDVMSEATYSSVLYGTTLEPYLSCAQILHDALRQVKIAETIRSTSLPWQEAIRIAIFYTRIHENLTNELFNRINPKQVTLAQAVKYFNGRQIVIQMRGSHINVPMHGTKLAAAATILSPLQSLGDTDSMQLLDGLLDRRYDHNVGRIRLHATPDTMGHKVERQLPCGLLYRFALKTLGHKAKSTNRKALATRAIEAATHFAALHDVEPYSVYETMLPPKPGKLITVLNEISTFDELFSIPQCEPSVIQRLLEDLRESTPAPEATVALQWSMNDALQLWNLLLQLVQHSIRSTFVSRKLFRGYLVSRVGQKAAEGLMQSFIIQRANAEYYFPSDAYSADTRDCCLVEASGNRYWLPGQLLLAPAFFSRLIGARAKHSLDFNGQMGKAFEVYLVKRMLALGISCRYGDVQGTTKSSTAGDIDLLLETEDTVGLFELKKKTLCRASTAGSGVQLIIDLAHGLVRGATQIAKHEITLIRSGELKFRDGPPLVLNGRRIIKGVISLADFGGLHDAAIVRNMLRGLTGATLTGGGEITPQQSKELQLANTYCATLLERYQEFESIKGKESNNDLFENFAFRNIFFVEYLLLRATTAKDFLAALSTGTRVLNGSRDPFFEHAQWQPR